MSCEHDHSHDNLDIEAIWINAGAFGDAVSKSINNAYWLALFFNIRQRAQLLGVSYTAFTLGILVALLSAGGAAYSNRNLNKQHTSEKKGAESLSTESLLEAGQYSIYTETVSEKGSLNSTSNKKHSLSYFAIIALTGGFISKVGEMAGPVNFVSKLAGENKLRCRSQILIQSMETLIFIPCNWAPVRTWINNLKKQNNHSSQSGKADFWTKISAYGELGSNFISDAYWLATLYDTMTESGNEVIGVSWPALVIGVIVASTSAIGATYCHKVVNTIHQSSVEVNEKIQGAKIELSNMQRVALLGDYISHIGELAGPITFVIQLATNNNLSQASKKITQLCSVLFGMVCAVANVKTCRINLGIKNYREKQPAPG